MTWHLHIGLPMMRSRWHLNWLFTPYHAHIPSLLPSHLLLHQPSAGLPRVLSLPRPRRIGLQHVAFRNRTGPCATRLALGCSAAAAAASGATLAAGGSGGGGRLAVRGVHRVEVFILFQHARGGPVGVGSGRISGASSE